MTRDDIILWARQAGWNWPEVHTTSIEDRLERFAALVAAQERESYEHTLALQQRSYEREIEIEVEAEREACAKVCEDMDLHNNELRPEYQRGLLNAARAIRARGQA